MADSTRKTPIFGNCCGSDTWSRRKGNRAVRRAVNVLLATTGPEGFESVTFPESPEVRLGDPWTWPQDGRRWAGNYVARLDPEVRNRVMAK